MTSQIALLQKKKTPFSVAFRCLTALVSGVFITILPA
jgi:hypothetical protein